MSQEAEESRARAKLYALCAQMVAREPSLEFLQELKGAALFEIAEGLGLSPPPIPDPGEVEPVFESLRAEHARLFVLPGTPLRPYESVQRGEERLWGEATVAVQQAYGEAGFILEPGAGQVPDHLAVELEFMSQLALQEAEKCETGMSQEAEALRESQRSFLREHLGTWAPGLARAIKNETREPYFRFVAEMLATVMESDRDFFGIGPEGA